MTRSLTFKLGGQYYTFIAPSDARLVACTDIVARLNSYFAQQAITVARYFHHTVMPPTAHDNGRQKSTRQIELPRSCPHEYPCSACKDSQFLGTFTHDGHPSPFAGISKLVEQRDGLMVTEIVRPNHGAVVTWLRFGQRFKPVCGPWYIAETRYHYGVGKSPDAAVLECLIAGQPKPDATGIRSAIASLCRKHCSPAHAWRQGPLEALTTTISRHLEQGYPHISLCGLTALISKLIRKLPDG